MRPRGIRVVSPGCKYRCDLNLEEYKGQGPRGQRATHPSHASRAIDAQTIARDEKRLDVDFGCPAESWRASLAMLSRRYRLYRLCRLLCMVVEGVFARRFLATRNVHRNINGIDLVTAGRGSSLRDESQVISRDERHG